jgi:hypothetical protein
MEIGRGGQICIGENKPTAYIANSMEGEKALRSWLKAIGSLTMRYLVAMRLHAKSMKAVERGVMVDRLLYERSLLVRSYNNETCARMSSLGASSTKQALHQNRRIVLPMPSDEIHIGIAVDPSVDQLVV